MRLMRKDLLASSRRAHRMIYNYPQRPGETSDPFAYLYPCEFVLLVTFRKTHVGVPTAMWFAHEQGKLYMVTGRTSGKIKHIRNQRQVLLAPCDVIGNVLGPQVKGLAHELPAARHASANALLAKKYGEQYEGNSSDEADPEEEETFIEIVPLQGEDA
jgi:PPOX class probable F420-dependent enzyme